MEQATVLELLFTDVKGKQLMSATVNIGAKGAAFLGCSSAGTF